MREILFRGKRLDTREWIYGYFFLADRKTMIQTESFYTDVLPKTVGQFTGLYDKNGKRIFEGDVVEYQFADEYPTYTGIVKFGVHVIKDSFKVFGFYLKVIQHDYYDNIPLDDDGCFKVIGNIFDNPDLLEG